MRLTKKQFKFLQGVLRFFNSRQSTFWGDILRQEGWTREEQVAFMQAFDVTPYQPWPPTGDEMAKLLEDVG